MVSHGNATVTTAGTAVPLSATRQPCAWVTIFPSTNTQGGVGNTGQVRVGGPPFAADTGAIPKGKGMPMSPGDSGVTWPIIATNGYNLADIYIDADTNGDGVQYIWGAP